MTAMVLGRLLDLAHAHDVRVEWRDLGERRRGEYRHGERLIVMSARLTGAQMVCTLAHELGHAVHGDMRSTPATERRADAYAARLLVCPGRYRRAERMVGPHPGALAVELGVTRAVIEALQRDVLVGAASLASPGGI